MARPLRIEYEGAVYHITARGNERRKIFFSPADYKKFREYLIALKQKYSIIIHSYVLMTNHYHLIVETPYSNLSKAMHFINSAYATYLNIKQKRSGHLFQGRYKSILVDRDNYLLELSRYVHLNPVRAGLAGKPEDYEYSSYRAYAYGEKDKVVDQDTILSMITSQTDEAMKSYRNYINNGIGEDIKNPFEEVYGGFILGKEHFIKEVQQQLKEDYLQKKDTSYKRELKSTHKIEELIDRVAGSFMISAEDIKMNRNPNARKVAIYLAKVRTGMINKEIGKYFNGISDSAVAKINVRFINEMEKDKRIRELVFRLEKNLSNVKG